MSKLILLLISLTCLIPVAFADIVCLEGPHGKPCQIVDTEAEVMSSMQWLAKYKETDIARLSHFAEPSKPLTTPSLIDQITAWGITHPRRVGLGAILVISFLIGLSLIRQKKL